MSNEWTAVKLLLLLSLTYYKVCINLKTGESSDYYNYNYFKRSKHKQGRIFCTLKISPKIIIHVMILMWRCTVKARPSLGRPLAHIIAFLSSFYPRGARRKV